MPGEAEYQSKLIKKLHVYFPDCYILKNDPSETQGIPDLLILVGGRWAMLETKVSERAAVRPNQEFYVEKFNSMGFASFIYPEIESHVLDSLQEWLYRGENLT